MSRKSRVHVSCGASWAEHEIARLRSGSGGVVLKWVCPGQAPREASSGPLGAGEAS